MLGGTVQAGDTGLGVNMWVVEAMDLHEIIGGRMCSEKKVTVGKTLTMRRLVEVEPRGDPANTSLYIDY